jgi:hypothetical protein
MRLLPLLTSPLQRDQAERNRKWHLRLSRDMLMYHRVGSRKNLLRRITHEYGIN